jgi:formylglycine-generating enzyme required for sulfatase activity
MDIYAMGLVLAELFMGEPVVQSDNFYGCVVRHLTGNLKFPPALLEGPLGPVIRKACARQPEERYPDAQALLEALEAVQTSVSQSGQLPIALTTSSPGLVIHADTELSLAIPRPERSAPDGFSLIIPGSFQMGSPEDEPSRSEDETLHEVTLSRAFFLQTCEVTWAQWKDVMGHAPFKDKPKRPIRSVSWYDAVAYCNALSTQQGLIPYYFLEGSQGKPGRDFRVQRVIINDPDADGWRLPTEAEWEYACRAGEEVEQARHGNLRKIAWYDNNARRNPRAVGGLDPNAWGLHDMLGNVWEWVWDRYGDYGSRRVRDPAGPSSSPFRVYRGASFSSSASLCRAANRGHSLPDRRYPNVGFRVARNCI